MVTYILQLVSAVDIFENIRNDEGELTKDWYGFFGLLGETFDKNNRPLGVYHKLCYAGALLLFAGEFRSMCLYSSNAVKTLTGGCDRLRRADAVLLSGL